MMTTKKSILFQLSPKYAVLEPIKPIAKIFVNISRVKRTLNTYSRMPSISLGGVRGSSQARVMEFVTIRKSVIFSNHGWVIRVTQVERNLLSWDMKHATLCRQRHV